MKQQSGLERIYALDALRAIMMLLGIVLHAGITYASGDYASFWPIKNPQNSIVFDLVVAIIHHFRMPVFFVVAGYFGALLFYKKGPDQMLVNRLKRVLLPFVAGVLLVYPMAAFSFAYTTAAFAGNVSPLDNAWHVITTGEFLPFTVLHLWFLYFLAFYSLGGWLIAKIFNRDTTFTRSAHRIFTYILQNFWLRLACLTFALFLCFFWIGAPYLTTNNKWSIDPPICMTYFLFFETGWIIFKTNSLSNLKKYPVAQLISAVLLFLVFILIPWHESADWLYVKELLSAFFCCLFIFGFIAFFMTYFNTYSRRLSYMMEAAYWVYIIHLPIVAFVPGLMADVAISPFLKFLVSLSVTAVFCFVSYHYGVRNTFIGVFLNGKSVKKKQTPVVN